jgi:hypothetical protein
MSTTFMTAVNELLQESNEVPLTSGDFSSAVGIQASAKSYINRAYLEICGKEVRWPFLSASSSNTNEPYSGNVKLETVVGQRWYLAKVGSISMTTDYSKIDWDSLYVTTEGVAGATTPYEHENLKWTDYDQWTYHLRESENEDASEAQDYGKPKRVIQSPDTRYIGLSPIPDKVYNMYFTAWVRPTKLALFSDELLIPDEYIPVLQNGANYYLLKWKKDFDEANLTKRDYDQGLRQMYRALLSNSVSTMRDDRIRY